MCIRDSSGLTHSGFNTVGTNVSGFNNSASGATASNGVFVNSAFNGNISGFGNTAIGHPVTAPSFVNTSTAGGMSGFFNNTGNAGGASLLGGLSNLAVNGMVSGAFNTGVTAAIVQGGITIPSGGIAGLLSGVGNSFTGIPGYFNLLKILQGK